MIDMNRKHPKFDLDLEVLAFISTTPVSRLDIANDLGHSTLGGISRCVSNLRTRGYRVHSGERQNLFTDSIGYKKIHDVSIRYLNEVYGRR